MLNSKLITRIFSIFSLAVLFAVLGSCSSGDKATTNTTPGTTAGTGTVALLLTDAPSDIFEEINITVLKAELLADSGAVTIFTGNRTFNLLDLTDARIFAIREGIAAGTYSKIRLTLSKIELVDYNDQSDPIQYIKYYPKLPGNGKLDLNPRGSFDVVNGGTLTIQIDMDANKSVHVVGNGANKYQFRPVVFITIVTDSYEERYVKLHGDIRDIDSTDQTFKLCNTNIPVQTEEDKTDDSSSGCVRVAADSASIFGIDGMPAAFINLVDGEPATVFGHLLRDASSDKDSGDDDDDDEKDNDENDNDHELDDLILKAALIELGPESAFRKLNGEATSIVDTNNDQFTMDVDPGQGLSTPLSLKVQIQTGTLLINLQGEPVASTDIDIGKLVNVRGVLDVANDTLFASLIMIDTDSSTQLTGTVGANPDANCGFTITTASGDRSIATNSETKSFLVSPGSSSPIEVGDLGSGQQADVYGNENVGTGCFDAHTIIAYPIPTI